MCYIKDRILVIEVLDGLDLDDVAQLFEVVRFVLDGLQVALVSLNGREVTPMTFEVLSGRLVVEALRA